jgi:predicted nucleic acid-binding protein
MATYLLDTDIIIDVLNGKKDRPNLLRSLLAGGHLLACCSISVTEVYAGLRPGEEQKTSNFLHSLKYYSIDFSIARLAGTLKCEYRRNGRNLNITDTTIAAVALQHDLPLITGNKKDFPMKDLRLYL